MKTFRDKRKLVIFHRISKLLGPYFRPRFSRRRSGDMRNLTSIILKVSSSDFMKIQADFDLLFLFPSYSHLKSGPVGPDTYPAQDLGPNILRTKFFPDMRFSQKGREGLHLTSYQRLEKSNDQFSRKFRKTSIFTIFWHFFQIFWKTGFFFKNPTTSLFLLSDCLTSCKKSEKNNERFSVTFDTDGHTDYFLRL